VECCCWPLVLCLADKGLAGCCGDTFVAVVIGRVGTAETVGIVGAETEPVAVGIGAGGGPPAGGVRVPSSGAEVCVKRRRERPIDDPRLLRPLLDTRGWHPWLEEPRLAVGSSLTLKLGLQDPSCCNHQGVLVPETGSPGIGGTVAAVMFIIAAGPAASLRNISS